MESFCKHDHEAFTKGRWQWKADLDPSSKSETSDWKFYSLEENYLIEKAYYDQQREVNIGDYIVSIQHKIQKKKGLSQSQRSIRRINFDETIEEIYRKARYDKTELPKTMNKVFGSLKDFLNFLSRRNPEIWEFASQFEKIEKENNIKNLNEYILPKLICCLEELVKPVFDQIEDSSLSAFKKKMVLKTRENHKKLILLFKKQFQSLEEFYQDVSKAYTMATCLYDTLNRYLRSENWIELDSLLPYTFCLCKAFFSFKFNEKCRDNEKQMGKEKSIVVYRGAAFTVSEIGCYQSKAVGKYFSWYSVTSASKSEKAAKNFMYSNQNIEEERHPVMFIIEIPLLSELERLLCLDIHQYSEKIEEDEVILAPGSVFELVEISTNPDTVTTIKLKLTNELQALANRGLIMHGAWQDRMTTEKEVKIVYLEDEELSENLKYLKGNKLIEEVEFSLCTFDNRSLRIMAEILPTLGKVERLKFSSCVQKEDEDTLNQIFSEAKECKISKIEIDEGNDFYKIFMVNNEDNKYWLSVTDLRVNFRNRVNAKGDKMENKWLRGLKHLPKLTHLTLDFSWCFQDEGPYNLSFEGVESLTELISLTITLSGYKQITDESAFCLASQVLRKLKRLRSLTLDFYDCRELTDKGVSSLASEGLGNLTQLTSLSLDFRRCPKITNEGFYDLASKGLKNLTESTSLSLYFYDCPRLQDQGLRNLVCEGLKHLSQLKCLTLEFPKCFEITDKGFSILACEGLQSLTQLTSFTLNFFPANAITNKGINSLSSEGFKNLTELTSLTLQFCGSIGISDEALKCLAYQGLPCLTKLTSLSLRFSESSGITDEGVCALSSEGLSHLTQLKSLSLNFCGCFQITSEGVQILSQRLKHFAHLTSLALCFSSSQIKTEGIQSLTSEGLKNLTELTSLTLCFPNCPKIKDEAVDNLGSKGLRFLTKLISLTLDFSRCEKISKEGVHSLVSEGLYHLIQLTSLTLNLSGCKRITHEEINSLVSQSLKHFNQLIFIPKGKSKLKLVSKMKNLWTEEIFEPPETKRLFLKRNLDISEEIPADVNSENCPPDKAPMSPDSLENSPKSHKASLPKKGILQPVDLNAQEESKFSPLHRPNSPKIMDEEVSILVSQKPKPFASLKSFSLYRERCEAKTEKENLNLESEALPYFTQLKSLSEVCKKMTNREMQSFAFYGLQNMRQLISLTLDFNFCVKITNKGIESLAFDGLSHLNQLTSLSLNFRECQKIRNPALGSLASNGLGKLRQLKSLTLCFSNCRHISDSGLRSLSSEGLKYLSSLTSLSLDFSHCFLLTGRGLQSLASEGLKSLSQLASLSLNFSYCNKITDPGVSRLQLEGIRYLTQLRSLNLNFEHCRKITKFGLSLILQVLYYFGFFMTF